MSHAACTACNQKNAHSDKCDAMTRESFDLTAQQSLAASSTASVYKKGSEGCTMAQARCLFPSL